MVNLAPAAELTFSMKHHQPLSVLSNLGSPYWLSSSNKSSVVFLGMADLSSRRGESVERHKKLLIMVIIFI